MNKSLKTVIFSFFIVSCSVNSNNKLNDNNRLEIIRNQITRGNSQSQIVNSNETLIVVNNDTIMKKTKKEDWQKIETMLHKIELSNLEMIVVDESAKAHQYDGAPITTITVKDGTKNYYSPSYDTGKAPKEIHDLDEFLSSLSK